MQARDHYERGEPATAALDGYLAGEDLDDLPLRLEPADLVARLGALMDPGAPDVPAEALPRMILLHWRIARALGQALGVVSEEELIEDAVQRLGSSIGDPWRRVHARKNTVGERLLIRDAAKMVTASGSNGASLLPPRAPHDEVVAWCEIAAAVADDLGAWRSMDDRDALRLIVDPRLACRSEVSSHNICALEEILADEALGLILQHGERAAADHFRSHYGLSRKEAWALLALARTEALARARGTTVEAERAMAMMRLKDYMDRTRGSLAMGDELRAEKLFAIVAGLTKSGPEDHQAIFREAVQNVAERQDAELEISDLVLPSSPRSEVPDSMPANLSTEDEILVEFDREN